MQAAEIKINPDYDQQKEIAIEAWNTNTQINKSIIEIANQYKESKEQASKTFFKAMNNMITILFEERKVQSIQQALMYIASDLQDECIDFPKSHRRLGDYVDKENSRRILQNMVRTQTEERPQEIIEQSSIITDLDLFDNLFYSPRPYDVWNYQIDRRFGIQYPGNIPAGIVLQTLYFFTDIGSKVVDPMAGGGVVGDCCREVKRNCFMYDINPTRKDIQKHDITKGLPEEAEDADLVFWDPPYYKKLEKDYDHSGSISSMNRSQYLQSFKNAALDFHAKGVKMIALLMSNFRVIEDVDNRNKEETIWYSDYVNLFHDTGKWQLINEIHCPLSTEQVQPQAHVKFVKEKKIARINRVLFVFMRK